jgi:hypothetical protein
MGMLNNQVKPHREATSPRTISGIIYLSAKNARELRTSPESQEDTMEALTDLYEPTSSIWGHTGHVIYSWMLK